LTLFLLFYCSANSQTRYSTEKQDSTNVYHKAIIEFCDYVNNQFPNVDKLNFEEVPTTTMFPNEIEGIKINYVPRSEVKRRFKAGEIKYYCVISPMQLKDGDFFVSIITFKVDFQKNLWSEYKRNQIGFVSQGGIKSRFKYDANSNSLMFIASDGGIQYIE
jgi:hypothetical protein